MSHVYMKHSLAKALMDASMEKFSVGGEAQPQAQPVQKFGLGGLVGSIGGGILGGIGGTFVGGPGVGTYAGGALGSVAGGALGNSFDAGGGIGGLLGMGGSGGGDGLINPASAGTIAEARDRQTDVYKQQQSLAQSLLAQSQGQGPNPAQAQLAQATGNNAAQQGALMASQRGASANPALIARQAAMQGANIQQNAAGQSAVLQAQQQLAAQQALQQQYAQMAGASLGQEQVNQQGYSAYNNANAGMINARTQTQGGIFGGLLNAGGGLLSSGLLGGGGGGGGSGGAGGSLIGDQSGGAAAGAMYNGGGGTMMVSKGGKIPGKPNVQGNSEENDNVPALLSPGEIVLPRSVTQGGDLEKKAIAFLKHLKKGKAGFNDVVEARHTKRMCSGGRA